MNVFSTACTPRITRLFLPKFSKTCQKKVFLDNVFEKFQLEINEFDHMDDLSFDELCKEYRILSPETQKYANMLFERMAECDGYVDPRELAIIQKLSQCTQ